LQASWVGTSMILFSTTCWSLGTVLSRRLDIPHGPTGFGAEMLSAGLIALLLSAGLGEHWVLPHAPRVWWAWGYLVVFGSLIAFSAYRFVVERVSPTLASTYAYVNPPVALGVGWWLGKETFSANVLIGLPIVLGAVALHAWIQTRVRSRQHRNDALLARRYVGILPIGDARSHAHFHNVRAGGDFHGLGPIGDFFRFTDLRAIDEYHGAYRCARDDEFGGVGGVGLAMKPATARDAQQQDNR